MNTYTFNELLEYLHKDDKSNFIMSFNKQIDYMGMITKFTINSIYDVKKLDYMTNLQKLIINCALNERKIKSVLKHPNVIKITSLVYINQLGEFEPDVSKLTNLNHLKCSVCVCGYSKLKNLKFLELDGCYIEDISNLTLLKKLKISSCIWNHFETLDVSEMSTIEYLKLVATDKISLNISGCKKIKTLKFLSDGKIICNDCLPYLCELTISEKKSYFLNNEFPRLRKLKIFRQKEDFNSIYKFSKLQNLTIKFRNFEHMNGNKIFDISHFPELKVLRVTTESWETGANKVADEIYKVVNDYNRITIVGTENTKNIEELSIYGADKINISYLSGLRKLKYSCCNKIIGLDKMLKLNTLSCDVIPENINDYTKLSELKFYHKNLTDCVDEKEFLADFGKMTNTKLSSIYIKTEGKCKIIGIDNFAKLRELYIYCYDFDVNDIKNLKCLHKLSIINVTNTHHPRMNVSNMRELKYIELSECNVNDIIGISNSVTNLKITNTEIEKLDVTNLNLVSCELNGNFAHETNAYCILKGIENSNHLRQLVLVCVNMTTSPKTFSEIFPRLDNLIFGYVPDEKTETLNSKTIRKLNRNGIFYSCIRD